MWKCSRTMLRILASILLVANTEQRNDKSSLSNQESLNESGSQDDFIARELIDKTKRSGKSCKQDSDCGINSHCVYFDDNRSMCVCKYGCQMVGTKTDMGTVNCRWWSEIRQASTKKSLCGNCMNVSSCWIKKTNCEIAPAKTMWWDHSTRCPNHMAKPSTKFDCGKPMCKLSPITVEIHNSAYTYTHINKNDYFTMKYKNIRGETCMFAKPTGSEMHENLKLLYTFKQSGYWDNKNQYSKNNLECEGLSWFPDDYWTEVEYEAFDLYSHEGGLTFKDIRFIMYGVHYHVYNSRRHPREALLMSYDNKDRPSLDGSYYTLPVRKHTFPVEADKL